MTLQRPRWVFMGGELRPWEDATLHVSTEAVNRGLSVFEGIKGYWDTESERFGVLALHRHFERLRRSARLLHLPFEHTYEEFRTACASILQALCTHEADMWVRATLFAVEGHWGEGTVCDLVLTAYHQPKAAPDSVSVGVSTWRRSGDNSLPPRVKSTANYQVGRLARIEGRERGHSEMVLLNDAGRVAEGTGACIVMARDGRLYCPPASEGALESITLEIAEELAASRDMPIERRPIERTELLVADELAILGTLAEIALVRRIESRLLPPDAPLLSALQARFFAAVRGVEPHPAVDLEYLLEAPVDLSAIEDGR